MLDWIADTLGQLSIAPFWRPGVAFALSVAASILSWSVSDAPWAGVMFGFSIALAVWALAESIGGTLAGFAAGLLGWYLTLGLNTTLTSMRATPYGCVMIDNHSPANCIDDAIRKHHAVSFLQRPAPPITALMAA